MKKRILSFVLTIVMLLSVAPLGAFNLTASAETENGFEYQVNDNKATITGYTGSETELVIPSTLGGYPVTKIGYGAFEYCNLITSVSIPEGVLYIENAFNGCSQLVSVCIPQSRLYLDMDAFDDCEKFTDIYFNGLQQKWMRTETRLKNITVHCSDGDIPPTDFYYMLVDGEDNQVRITKYVGYDDELLIPTKIGNMPVTTIDDGAFEGCDFICITIPVSIKSIGWDAFADCYSLKDIYYLGNKEQWRNIFISSSNTMVFSSTIHCEDGNIEPLEFIYSVYDNTVSILKYTGNQTEVEIPETIEGYTVTSIGDYAFANCNSITSIKFPNSLINIYENAFECCESLQSVVIPESVEHIGDNAFGYCCSLSEILLPDSQLTIGRKAFTATAYYHNAENWESGDVNIGVLYIGNHLVEVGDDLSSCEIKAGTKTLANRLFEFCNITNIDIPSSVTVISEGVFSGCDALESINIPNSVTKICDDAFAYCRKLTNLTIPATVTSIGDYAFVECESIETITIPNSVISIGFNAFESCSSLTDVTVGNRVTNIEEFTFSNCGALEKISLPLGLTKIEYCAFSSCESLENIVIPDSVSYVGDGAFTNCSSLKTINIPKNVAKLSSFDYGIFSGCYSLESICVEAANPNYYSIDGVLFNKQKTEIIRFPQGKAASEYTIPNTVTKISSCAFFGCSSLVSVTIPNSIAIINYYAFDYCYSLTDVHYNGTETEWNNIFVDEDGNESLLNATIHFLGAQDAVCIHQWSWITDKAAMCSSTGTKHQECKLCHQKQNENTKIDATGKHVSNSGVVTKNATYDNEGIKTYSCNVCKTPLKTESIAKLPKTSLAKAKVLGIKDKAYTGKKATQSVTVKLGNVTLKKGTDYTVTCNDKNIGTATVTITGIGKYKDNIKKTFTIKPKTASVKSFKSPKKKQAKVTWGKDSKVTGYQIVYATNSKLTKGKKTVTVKSYKTTSKTIKSLKSKKTYYVKVRSYKTVKGKKIYGAYSKVKKVKVK